jgi:hypothetical protein
MRDVLAALERFEDSAEGAAFGAVALFAALFGFLMLTGTL